MESIFLDTPAWQVFLLVGISLSVLEIFVPGFILLPIGAGFILTAPVAAMSHSLALQLVVLSVLEILAFVLIRKYGPAAARSVIYSGAEGMVGQECEVLEEVSASKPGYVRLYGDRWQARTYSLHPIPVGSRAVIMKLDGNKVVVEPMNSAGGN